MLGPFGVSAVNAVQRAQNAVVSKTVSFLSNCLVRCTNSGTGKTVAAAFTTSKSSVKSDNAEPLLIKWSSAGVHSNGVFKSTELGARTSHHEVSYTGQVSEGDLGLLQVDNLLMFKLGEQKSNGIESPAAKPLTGILATPKEPPVDYEGQEATKEPTPAVPKKGVSFANDGKPTAVHT